LIPRKKKLQSSRVEQQRLIAIQARSAYQNNGREEYLKLLLNQQNPEKFARTLSYYDYLSKARMEQLRAFNETLRQLANVEQDISRQQEQLLAQRADLDSRRQALEAERGKRQQVLAKLNTDMKDGGQKLQAREQDQADLAKVLKTIEETLARQAREAEEARQKALLAQQEAEKRRQQEALAKREDITEPPKKGAYHPWPAGVQRQRQLWRRIFFRTGKTSLAGQWSTAGTLRRCPWQRCPRQVGRGDDQRQPRHPGTRRARRARGVRRLVARCWTSGHSRPW